MQPNHGNVPGPISDCRKLSLMLRTRLNDVGGLENCLGWPVLGTVQYFMTVHFLNVRSGV